MDYDLNNPEHKQIIKDFEKSFGIMNFMDILERLGYYKYSDYYPGGYVDGRYIKEIADIQDKYKALGKLMERRHYMELKEKEALQSL